MRIQVKMPIPLVCDVCQTPGVVYRETKSTYARLNNKSFGFYACVNQRCQALVTCSTNSVYPCGLMARKEIRQLRVEAHAAFDKLWECPTATWSRNEAYNWVVTTLEVPFDACNISRLSKEKLLELIEQSKNEYEKQVAIYRRRKNKKSKRQTRHEIESLTKDRKHTLIRVSGCSKQKNDGKQLAFKRKQRESDQ